MSRRLTRREFLRRSSRTVLVLSMASLCLGPGCGEPEEPVAGSSGGESRAAGKGSPTSAAYGDWRDVYREKWSWDRIAHCSHTRANCLSACAWNVYVKDGVVWREEQAQAYDHGGRGGAPDFFPRGCQKGACYSDLMASPQRLRYPMERVGERGSGKWKRISWARALQKVADGIIDAADKHGPETVVHIPGPNFDQGPSSCSEFRFARSIRATVLDTFAGIGDMPIGCIQTYGMFLTGGTSDDWFNSDYIILWSANPAYTRIPDMHFLTGARYRGARVVIIGPDYNATAMHTDLWINPKVESDPALALAMAQVIIAEGLVDEDYVREQTDLPFLVRRDNRRFLRESDVKRSGRDDVFFVWDEIQNSPVFAPGCQGMTEASLRLEGIQPALTGIHKVKLADGSTVIVETVYELLRRHLDARYTPESVVAEAGVAASLIRRVARETAAAGAAMIYASVGACKHYHSDLMHRSMALLMALTGNQGRAGGGLRVGSWWGLTGFDEFSQMHEMPWWQKLVLKVTGRPPVREVEKFLTDFSRTSTFTPSMPWLYVHGGYQHTMGAAEYNDSENPLSVGEAMETAIDKKWIPIYPRPGKDPKVFIVTACNPLRRWPAPQVALEHLWPKFDLVVNVNTQMSTTGMYSDVLLPAAGFYEKEGIKYAWGLVPYLVLDDKAVEPLGESRSEWWIFGNLARIVQERARARAIPRGEDVFGVAFELKSTFDVWSDKGTYDPADQGPAMDYIFEHSEICRDTNWKEAIERGVVPIKRNGMYSTTNNMCSDVDFEKPLYPHVWQVEGKESWPTVTGRQQFYLDQEWYLAAGEALPVHKGPPPAGGDYPLRLTGGHTRWSIHAIWRGEELLQRLQRGEPVLYMNLDDARTRRIVDNDRVHVFNDVGGFECLAKPAPTVQPGQIIIYHAWESFQFAGGKGQQEPIPSPWKALHLVGEYGQLHYRGLYGAPNFAPRGATVEVEAVTAPMRRS